MNVHKLGDGLNGEPYGLEKLIKRLLYYWAIINCVNNIEVFTSVVVIKKLADNAGASKGQNI